jgi:hypothetical protein
MSVLKTLNFVAVTKRSNDPVIMRRAKLIMQLQQQRSLADNLQNRVNFIINVWCVCGLFWFSIESDEH